MRSRWWKTSPTCDQLSRGEPRHHAHPIPFLRGVWRFSVARQRLRGNKRPPPAFLLFFPLFFTLSYRRNLGSFSRFLRRPVSGGAGLSPTRNAADGFPTPSPTPTTPVKGIAAAAPFSASQSGRPGQRRRWENESPVVFRHRRPRNRRNLHGKQFRLGPDHLPFDDARRGRTSRVRGIARPPAPSIGVTLHPSASSVIQIQKIDRNPCPKRPPVEILKQHRCWSFRVKQVTCLKRDRKKPSVPTLDK